MQGRDDDIEVFEMFAKDAHSMKINRRRGLFRLWLAGTLALLIGTGLILRPDRDVAQFLNYQNVKVDETNLQTRQLVTHIRLLRGNGLTFDQIKDQVLSNGAPDVEIVNKMIELEAGLSAKAHAERRLTLFAAIALFPPLIILELGGALFWARRGYRAWTNAFRVDLRDTVLCISKLPLRLSWQASSKQI